jgi:hypothetical protein
MLFLLAPEIFPAEFYRSLYRNWLRYFGAGIPGWEAFQALNSLHTGNGKDNSTLFRLPIALAKL